MTIEEFWNQAFLAALTRLQCDEAEQEADRATERCIAHWRRNAKTWAPDVLVKWQDQDIANIKHNRIFREDVVPSESAARCE